MPFGARYVTLKCLIYLIQHLWISSTISSFRVWLSCGHPLVCRACWPHHPLVWCTQTRDLWWVFTHYNGIARQWGQAQSVAQQGWHGGLPGADASLWRTHVVTREGVLHTRGSEGLHWHLLVLSHAYDRQSKTVWARRGRPFCRHSEPATKFCTEKTQWSGEASTTCEGEDPCAFHSWFGSMKSHVNFSNY